MRPVPTLRALFAVVLAIPIGPERAVGSPPGGEVEIQVKFRREIVNLEFSAGRLQRDPPVDLKEATRGESSWYGEIPRKLPGDRDDSRTNHVWFAVSMDDGSAGSLQYDSNGNGDVSDDPQIRPSLYPSTTPARSFLLHVSWPVHESGQKRLVDWLVRIVVHDQEAPGAPPAYRLQDVYGMLGSVELDGRRTQALLFDANRDGVYARGQSDGIFLDLDGDRHFPINVMSPSFGPLAIPFIVGDWECVVDSVARDGSRLAMRVRKATLRPEPPQHGKPAPDFSYVDIEGRRVRLSDLRGKTVAVYFWASWCGVCRRQGEDLRSLYERLDRARFQILGINYDLDRQAMVEFRRTYGHAWPTSFSGGYPAEDPIGRMYGEAGAGVFYIVGPDGLFQGKTYGVDALAEMLTQDSPAR